MTRYDIYTIAGNGGTGTAGNGGPATSANLNGPGNSTVDAAGNLYITDTANNRVQEVPVASGVQWGQAMTANYAYTVAGSSCGSQAIAGTEAQLPQRGSRWRRTCRSTLRATCTSPTTEQ